MRQALLAEPPKPPGPQYCLACSWQLTPCRDVVDGQFNDPLDDDWITCWRCGFLMRVFAGGKVRAVPPEALTQLDLRTRHATEQVIANVRRLRKSGVDVYSVSLRRIPDIKWHWGQFMQNIGAKCLLVTKTEPLPCANPWAVGAPDMFEAA